MAGSKVSYIHTRANSFDPQTERIFTPRVPLKKGKSKVKGSSKHNPQEKASIFLPSPLCYLTEEMIAVMIEYHTLRSLAYKNMNLKLGTTSNYKIERIDNPFIGYELESPSQLDKFEKRWKSLVKYSALHWPEAVTYMNSLSSAYLSLEQDTTFKRLSKVGPTFLTKLTQHFSKIFNGFSPFSLKD